MHWLTTGLDFAEARMYENRHARFTAVDPLLASGKSANPQTFNRYVYVGNSPLVLTDPTGLQAASVGGNNRKCTNDCGPGGGTWRTEGNSTTIFPDANIAGVQSHRADFQPIPESTVPLGMTAISAPITTRSPLNSTIAPLSNGVVEGVNDAETGAWRGLKNLGIGLVNFSTQPGGVQGSLIGIPNPFAISPYPYENLRQARFGTGVEIGLPTGLGVGAGFFSAGPVSYTVAPKTIDSVRVSQQGLDLVKNQLSRFDRYEPNEMMVARLEKALESGQRIRGADRNFYMHEESVSKVVETNFSVASFPVSY